MTARDRRLSGIATYAIAVLVGIGAGLVVLSLAARYSDDKALVALRLANGKTETLARSLAAKSHDASIAACKRGNKLRANINATNRTQVKFLSVALEARRAAVKTAKTPADRRLNQDAADSYVELIANTRTVPLVDCAAAFPSP